MTVVDRKPIPIYEVECYECHSKIQYRKAEVAFCSITCPVCGVSVQANTICPVRMESTDEEEHRMSEWISVKDRLPELHHIVIIYDGYDVGAGSYQGNDDKGQIWMGDDFSDYNPEVTYWMPLPEPPTEVEG